MTDVVLGLGFLVHMGFILDMQLHDNMASFSDFYHYITALFVDDYLPVMQMLVFETHSARAGLILMIYGSCLVLVFDTHLYTILYYLLHQAMKTSFVLCSLHRLVQMPWGLASPSRCRG